eukprot:COSAG02_NODE_685_length_18484_cov_49.605330_11_plen_45_part_00
MLKDDEADEGGEEETKEEVEEGGALMNADEREVINSYSKCLRRS